MMGFLVFGTLSAVLAAELYFLFKKEEEEEHKCNCGCCHRDEDEIKIVDSQGRECCNKNEE